MNKRLKIRADKCSGLEGTVFAMSYVLPSIAWSSTMKNIHFPFYCLTADLETNKIDEWIDNKQYKKETEKLIRTIKKEGFNELRKTAKWSLKRGKEVVAEHFNLCKKLPTLSDQQLISEFNKFNKRYITDYNQGVVTFLYESILSDELFRSLSSRYEDTIHIITNLLASDYRSFMLDDSNPLKEIRNAKLNKQKQLFKKYLERFYYTNTNYLYSREPSFKEVLKQAKQSHKGSDRKKILLESKVKLLPSEKLIVDLLRISEVIRDQRKKINTAGNYVIFKFIHEASKRTGVAEREIKKMFFFEYEKLFTEKTKILKQLKRRKKASLLFWHGKEYYLEYNPIVASKDAAGKIKGTPASKGIVSGVARVILGPSQFKNFKRGQILISEMTRPDFLPIMKIAKAIVTDEGGLTCHAAIVARELGIPCIVGTSKATSVIKDGQRIVVDANKGEVRVI